MQLEPPRQICRLLVSQDPYLHILHVIMLYAPSMLLLVTVTLRVSKELMEQQAKIIFRYWQAQGPRSWQRLGKVPRIS
jgi:hypothetical protein